MQAYNTLLPLWLQTISSLLGNLKIRKIALTYLHLFPRWRASLRRTPHSAEELSSVFPAGWATRARTHLCLPPRAMGQGGVSHTAPPPSPTGDASPHPTVAAVLLLFLLCIEASAPQGPGGEGLWAESRWGRCSPTPAAVSSSSAIHGFVSLSLQTERFVRRAHTRWHWRSLSSGCCSCSPARPLWEALSGSPLTWNSTLALAHTCPEAVHPTPDKPPYGL